MFPAKSVPFIDIEYLDPSLRLFRLIMEEISLLPLFFSLSDNQANDINELKILGHQFFLTKNELTNPRIIVLVKFIIKNIYRIKKSYQKINTIKKSNIKNIVKKIKL